VGENGKREKEFCVRVRKREENNGEAKSNLWDGNK